MTYSGFDLEYFTKLTKLFWSHVDKGDNESCWNWQASCYKHNGYGAFSIKRRSQKAHRVSWIIHFGDIPNGLKVLHTCDNRKCVNPNHLFLGTYDDNNKDRAKKNRSATNINPNYGESNGNSKLRKPQVDFIKQSSLSSSELSRILNVSPSTVCRIRNKRTWINV